MSFLFAKHYTVEEARALLPDIRQWLGQIAALKEQLAKLDLRLTGFGSGNDVGGETVNESIKLQMDLRAALRQFVVREIQIKDVDRGLIDFPALRNGNEIFLCWEKDEEDIQHWHDLESGYSGREPL